MCTGVSCRHWLTCLLNETRWAHACWGVRKSLSLRRDCSAAMRCRATVCSPDCMHTAHMTQTHAAGNARMFLMLQLQDAFDGRTAAASQNRRQHSLNSAPRSAFSPAMTHAEAAIMPTSDRIRDMPSHFRWMHVCKLGSQCCNTAGHTGFLQL